MLQLTSNISPSLKDISLGVDKASLANEDKVAGDREEETDAVLLRNDSNDAEGQTTALNQRLKCARRWDVVIHAMALLVLVLLAVVLIYFK